MINLNEKNKQGIYDELGRNTSCHFLSRRDRKIKCTALKGFYNDEHSDALCMNCPFFKTTDEYRAGFINRNVISCGPIPEAV